MPVMRTLSAAVVTAVLLASSPASARSVKSFLKSPGTVVIEGPVEVPLLRGEVGEHRPLVEVELKGDAGSERRLAVLDVAHGWTRVGWRTVYALGLASESTTLQGRAVQVVVLPEVRVGELVLRDVAAEVDGMEGVTIGTAALGLPVAVLPSSGTVRFVPAADGADLVASVGDVVPAQRQTAKSFKVGDRKVSGNGLAFAVEGAVAGRDGTLQIRTDMARTEVTASFEDTRQRRRGGVVHARGRGRVGAVELPETWVVRNESLVDADARFVGALGYDQLYAVDLAVDPSSDTMALKPVAAPEWTDASEAHLAVARAAHAAAGLASEDERVDRPPRMGFGATAEDPAGDPGDPGTVRLERELAMALWATGAVDEAMPHFLKAAEAAGDQCGPQMELGLKRLQWSGSMQQQTFIVELIRQPLKQAGTLWDRWASLTPELREDVRARRDVPDGTFSVEQEARCLTAWGTLMAAYVAQGDTDASSAIYKDHYGKDPLVAYAQGLSLLEQGQPKTAEIPIREALSFDVAERGDVKLGLGRAQAEQGLKEPVFAVLKEIPGLAQDHGLAAAMIVLEWGALLGEEDEGAAMARRLVEADPYWAPAQLMAIWRGVEEADVAQLSAELNRRSAREAGSLDVAIHRAVLAALQGDGAGARKDLRELQKSRPPHADLYAALALVASINGRWDRVEDNLLELRLRYPTLPFDDLTLRAPEPTDEPG